MAKSSIEGAAIQGTSAPGRAPPPADKRFVKGKSGNARGRPRGAVSLDAMTRKFALHQDTISIGGKQQRMSRLAIALQVLKAQAADGKPSAIRLVDELRAYVAPDPSRGGVLVVPAPMSDEKLMAYENDRCKDTPMPGTAINLQAEEFQKALRGEVSPYGAALLAHHRKYYG